MASKVAEKLRSVLLKGTASELALSAVEWVPPVDHFEWRL
jgi:hypothetical protein